MESSFYSVTEIISSTFSGVFHQKTFNSFVSHSPHKSPTVVGKGLFSVSGISNTRNPAITDVMPKIEFVTTVPLILDRVYAYGARMLAMQPNELTIPTALLRTIVGKTWKKKISY